MKLAFVAPAVLAALPVGVAAADSGHGARGRGLALGHREDDASPGRGLALGHREDDRSPSPSPATSPLLRQEGRLITFAAALCRAADAADFTAIGGSAGIGSDRLTSGVVRVAEQSGSDAALVHVRLDGAEPNTTYQAVFVPFNGPGSPVGLGNVATNGDGDLRGLTPNQLPAVSGKKGRVGIFVLRRDVGSGNGVRDQFVTCAHG